MKGFLWPVMGFYNLLLLLEKTRDRFFLGTFKSSHKGNTVHPEHTKRHYIYIAFGTFSKI